VPAARFSSLFVVCVPEFQAAEARGDVPLPVSLPLGAEDAKRLRGDEESPGEWQHAVWESQTSTGGTHWVLDFGLPPATFAGVDIGELEGAVLGVGGTAFAVLVRRRRVDSSESSGSSESSDSSAAESSDHLPAAEPAAECVVLTRAYDGGDTSRIARDAAFHRAVLDAEEYLGVEVSFFSRFFVRQPRGPSAARSRRGWTGLAQRLAQRAVDTRAVESSEWRLTRAPIFDRETSFVSPRDLPRGLPMEFFSRFWF